MNSFETGWTYDKKENLTIESLTTNQSITHLITESLPSRKIEKKWVIVEAFRGFDRRVIDWNLFKGIGTDDILDRLRRVVRIDTSEKLWILKRRN